MKITWVSVTTKLPPQDYEVLVYDTAGRYHRARRIYNGTHVIWAYHDQDCGLDNHVTHWGELPIPPMWGGSSEAD